MDLLDRRPHLWLALGTILIAIAHLRFGVGVLALVAPIPFLRFLRLRSGALARLALVGALAIAWTLAVLKITTSPIPPAFALLFAVPIAIAHGSAYLGWDLLRRRTGAALSAPIFASAMAIAEWTLFTLTPFASWGSAAHAALDDLPLLQLASVAGIAGVGFVVNLIAGALERALDAGLGTTRRELAVALGLALTVHAGGAIRLALADERAPETVTVAAVATDSDVGGLPLPDRDTTHAWDRALIERTRVAAAGGAELVVWPETATLVWPDEEDAWVDALRATARETGADIVAGYVVATSLEPLLYRNEYRLVLRDGTALEPYAKHRPAPGEPAIAGTGPAPVTARPWGRLSGAICYDYDFPAVGLERARAGADVVAVPSSDWRGIDPIHAQMAALRAIEGGHSMIRATRWGLSLAADPYGRTRGWQSSFERGPGVMLATLPTSRVPTLYAWWGDTFVLVAAGFLLALAIRGWRLRRAAQLEPVAARS